MILTSELENVYSINEAWLRESLESEANAINRSTDTHIHVYNNRPNHFTIVVDDALEYMLDTTDYTAELTQHVSPLQDETLLVAVADDSDNFESVLAINIISAVYKTL
jgi:predicted TIM-barrel fold metal-dependent hydrolase